MGKVKLSNILKILGMFFGIVVLFIFGGFMYFNIKRYYDYGVPVKIPFYTKSMKIKECKNMVLEMLASPASAIFSNIEYNDYTIPFNSIDGVKIQGKVDSQNGFGAMLRSEFECEQKYSRYEINNSNMRVYIK